MPNKLTLPLLLLVTCFWLPVKVHAQTYFYFNQITVLPATPTDQDTVQLKISGHLSNTGIVLTSMAAHINGFTVGLAVGATGPGPIGVSQPHTELLDLGVLPAGQYTITIAGPGLQDTAPMDQHHFTVTAASTSSTCDSLIIASVSWSPFSDTAVLVHVFNPSLAAFDYPGFLLLDGNGDTLARETVNFFGLEPESWHTLTVHPGTVIPAGPFNGTLQLWTDFFSAMACNWEMNIDLCPADSCQMLVATIQNFGDGLTTGSFLYAIREDGVSVAQGTLTLTADQQFAQDSVCLPPGHYLMELVPEQGPNGGQPWFGIALNNQVEGPHAPVIWTTLDAVAFNLYEQCVGIIQEISEIPATGITVERSVGAVTLVRTDGKALGDLMVFDAQGRTVARAEGISDRYGIATSSWPAGLYIVRAIDADREVLTVRWVVE